MSRFKGGRRIDFDGKDQFFTKPCIAKHYVDLTHSLFPLNNYSYVLESSAGAGAFLDAFPKNKLGMDIDPQRSDIKKKDFFEYNPRKGKSYITIGNPPFGRGSKLAVDFFNHSAKFCKTIAYIIPNTWRFSKVQNRLDERFKLVHEERVPDFAFKKIGASPGKRVLDDGSININCVFQIWTIEDTDLPDLRVRDSLPSTHEYFDIIGYFSNNKKELTDDDDYDFLVKAWGGMPFAKRGPSPLCFGAVHSTTEGLKGNWRMQYTGIKSKVKGVKDVFKSIPQEEWWREVSSMNTITPDLLVKMYNQYK